MVLVTLELEFSKNWSHIIAYMEQFFFFFGHFMHNYAFRAIKSSFFAKMDDFLLNHPNISKFLAPAAQKMGHFSQFFGAFSAKKLVTLDQNWAPFWPLAPSNSITDTS